MGLETARSGSSAGSAHSQRPAHWAPSLRLGCSSEPPRKPLMSRPLALQASIARSAAGWSRRVLTRTSRLAVPPAYRTYPRHSGQLGPGEAPLYVRRTRSTSLGRAVRAAYRVVLSPQVEAWAEAAPGPALHAIDVLGVGDSEPKLTLTLTLTLTLPLPLHRHRSPLTAHLSPFTLTLTLTR